MLKLRSVGTILAEDAGPIGTFYAFKTLPMKVLKVLKPATGRFLAILRSWISAPAQDSRKAKIFGNFSFRMDIGCFPYGQWLFWQARIAPKGPTSMILFTPYYIYIILFTLYF